MTGKYATLTKTKETAHIVFLSLCFNGHFPGESELAGFIGDKAEGSGGDDWNIWFGLV